MNEHPNIEKVRGALTAIADMFGVTLELSGPEPYTVRGKMSKKLTWFDTDWNCEPTISASLVDLKREIVVVVVQVSGALDAVVLSDAQEGNLTLFLVDRSKLESCLLPRYWLRERLYQGIVKGLRVTYQKGFYDRNWKLKEVGVGWVEKYLEKKKSSRTTDYHTYRGTDQVGY